MPMNNDRTTIHIGSVATNSAARPEGTLCSAQCSEPWPTKKNMKPSTALLTHSRRVGRYPRTRAHSSNTDPAVR